MLAFLPMSVHIHGKHKYDVITKYSASTTSIVKQHKIAIGFIRPIILNLSFMMVISCVQVTMRDAVIIFKKLLINFLSLKNQSCYNMLSGKKKLIVSEYASVDSYRICSSQRG